MRINAPAVDYLRVTTFVQSSARMIWTRIASRNWAEARLLQYRGVSDGKIFFGEGEQRGKTHWLVDVPGETADNCLWMLDIKEKKVTRIDVQVTVALPVGYQARSYKDAILDGDWPGGKERGVTMIEGVDGLDTVYIGSRTSERFIRVYVKLDDDNAKYLRFEVQYSGGMARSAAEKVRQGQLCGLLVAELLALPEHDIHHCFVDIINAPPSERLAWETRQRNGTMDWLRASVIPALEKLLNEHDTSAETRLLLMDVLARTEDKPDTPATAIPSARARFRFTDYSGKFQTGSESKDGVDKGVTL